MSVHFLGEISPSVQWNHIDGPLLHCSDGGYHWLTLFERIALRMQWTTVSRLNQKVVLRRNYGAIGGGL